MSTSLFLRTQAITTTMVKSKLYNGDRNKIQIWKRAMAGWGTAIQSRMTNGTTKTFSSASESSSARSSSMDGRISAPRANRAVSLLPTYLADARAVERYSPSTPDGALQLSVAENQMLEDLLVPSINEFSSIQDFPADAIYYQPCLLYTSPSPRD